MEDAVLILAMAALFALGFIPVVKLDAFIRNRRKIIAKPERLSNKKNRRSENDPAEEFEENGIVYFDLPCDPGQLDDGDMPRME